MTWWVTNPTHNPQNWKAKILFGDWPLGQLHSHSRAYDSDLPMVWCRISIFGCFPKLISHICLRFTTEFQLLDELSSSNFEFHRPRESVILLCYTADNSVCLIPAKAHSSFENKVGLIPRIKSIGTTTSISLRRNSFHNSLPMAVNQGDLWNRNHK